MKKALKIFGLSLAGIFLLLLLLPFLFRGKILTMVDEAIQEAVIGEVYYDREQVSVSLFRRFPHMALGLGDFGIVGEEPFRGDTLVHVKELQVDFRLWSVLFGEYPTLSGIHLKGGELYVKVLADGRANYAILPPPEEEDVLTETGNLRIGIDVLELEDVSVIYDDRELDFFMALGSIRALGSGDFTSSAFEMPLRLEAFLADVRYEGISYLSQKQFKGTTTVDVDLDAMRFGFLDSDLYLNAFHFYLDGALSLPEDGIGFDLRAGTRESDFKTLLSLVPGLYAEQFSAIETAGSIDFLAEVNGIYSDTSTPSFLVQLGVREGMFRFPELALPVREVGMELVLANTTADWTNTRVNLRDFRMLLGDNPFAAELQIENFRDFPMEARLDGRLNLGELTAIFPIPDLRLAGELSLRGEAKGTYDSTQKTLPVFSADFTLKDGLFRRNDLPAALEALEVQASIGSASGRFEDFTAVISRMSARLDGEALRAKATFQDLSNLRWDLQAEGAANLATLVALFPQEGMELAGRIAGELAARGDMRTLESGRYAALYNAGTVNVSDFVFSSEDLPQGIQIQDAEATFNPDRMELKRFVSTLGESPLEASGVLTNYMGYLFREGEVLRGELNLRSPRFNANEWLSADASGESTDLEVFALPRNIQFQLGLDVEELLYDNLRLEAMRGTVQLADGVLRIRDAGLRTLGGQVRLSGSYDPRDVAAPRFDFNFGVERLDIRQAFEALYTVQLLAPVAQHLEGVFSTDLSFGGLLAADMMPVMASLDAKGAIRILEAAFQNPSFTSGISNLIGLRQEEALRFRNMRIPITIDNGVLEVEPFDLRLWDYEARLQGSTAYDGTIRYLLNLQVPAGRFGQQLNSALARVSGATIAEDAPIPVALSIGGSYARPTFSLAGEGSIEQLLASAVRARLGQEREQLQRQVTEEFRQREDSVKTVLKAEAERVQDSVRREAERRVDQTRDRAAEEARNLIRGVIGGGRNRPAAAPDTTKRKPE
ncbi:MAG: AsmA-like C-terminal region-containing protein [Nitritalea sp.]